MLEPSNSDLNSLAIYSVTTILVVTILVSAIAASVALYRSPDSASLALKEFFNGGDALKILTVFAVLVATTFLALALALAGELSEAAIALLSSVSGYVLGSMQSGDARKPVRDKGDVNTESEGVND